MQDSFRLFFGPLCAFALLLPASAGAGEVEIDLRGSAKPVCLPAHETQEEIKAHKLLEPFPVLKLAGSQFKAEPLAAKLCQIGDDYVYLITLLRKDGRVIHATFDALSGKAVAQRNAAPAAPKP